MNDDLKALAFLVLVFLAFWSIMISVIMQSISWSAFGAACVALAMVVSNE